MKSKAFRDLFPGHFRPTDDEMKALWDNALFVFDANVLLNFYRYSQSTRESLRRVLLKFRERIWLPFQAAEEFQRNRLGVIAKQTESYEETRKEAEQLLDKLKTPLRHPFVSDATLRKLESVVGQLKEELIKRQELHEGLIHSDPILVEIAELFDGRVGAEPDQAELTRFTEIAAKRLAAKVPPGYKDKAKDDGRDCGDAVLWLQTLEHAQAVKLPVILVTDDAKEDWWVMVRGKTIGARPELVKEFRQCVGLSFHLYQPSRFLEYAGRFLDEKTDPAVIEEVTRLTRERAVRSIDRARDGEARSYVRNLAEHLMRHRADVYDFLEIARSVSDDEWKRANHPMLLQPEALDRVQRLLRRCPCIGPLAHDVSEISPPGLSAVSDELDQMPREMAELFVALRRLPENAIKTAFLLSELRGGQDKGK